MNKTLTLLGILVISGAMALARPELAQAAAAHRTPEQAQAAAHLQPQTRTLPHLVATRARLLRAQPATLRRAPISPAPRQLEPLDRALTNPAAARPERPAPAERAAPTR